MSNKAEFDNIFNECLELMLSGEAGVNECLARYPEQADELRPLLETAAQTLAAADMKPSLEFREKARLEFGKAVHNARAGRGSLFGWAGRWATVALAVVILIVGSTSTVAASGGSMPDDTLYTVKLVVEDIREVFTFSEEKKAELHAEFTERRVTEIISMAEKGKPEAAQVATQRLGSHLDAIVMLEVGELPRMEMATFDAAERPTVDETPPIEEETVPTEEAPKLFQKGPAAEKAKGPPPQAAPRAGQEKAAVAPGQTGVQGAGAEQKGRWAIAGQRARLEAALEKATGEARGVLEAALAVIDKSYPGGAIPTD